MSSLLFMQILDCKDLLKEYQMSTTFKKIFSKPKL